MTHEYYSRALLRHSSQGKRKPPPPAWCAMCCVGGGPVSWRGVCYAVAERRERRADADAHEGSDGSGTTRAAAGRRPPRGGAVEPLSEAMREAWREAHGRTVECPRCGHASALGLERLARGASLPISLMMTHTDWGCERSRPRNPSMRRGLGGECWRVNKAAGPGAGPFLYI